MQWIEHCGLFMASRPLRCSPGCLCLCGQCVPWALLEGMSLSAVPMLSRAVMCCLAFIPGGGAEAGEDGVRGRVVAIGMPGAPPAPPVQTQGLDSGGLTGSSVPGLGLSCLGLTGLHSHLPCLSFDVLCVPMMLHSRTASSMLPAWFACVHTSHRCGESISGGRATLHCGCHHPCVAVRMG